MDRLTLTRTEQEVLRLAAQDMSIKQIAAARYVSPHTTNDHMKNIHRKLGVHTRHGAVAAAFRKGILE